MPSSENEIIEELEEEIQALKEKLRLKEERLNSLKVRAIVILDIYTEVSVLTLC